MAHVVGMFVERWLFFAEAKHAVMLYYGEGQQARSQPDRRMGICWGVRPIRCKAQSCILCKSLQLRSRAVRPFPMKAAACLLWFRPETNLDLALVLSAFSSILPTNWSASSRG